MSWRTGCWVVGVAVLWGACGGTVRSDAGGTPDAEADTSNALDGGLSGDGAGDGAADARASNGTLGTDASPAVDAPSDAAEAPPDAGDAATIIPTTCADGGAPCTLYGSLGHVLQSACCPEGTACVETAYEPYYQQIWSACLQTCTTGAACDSGVCGLRCFANPEANSSYCEGDGVSNGDETDVDCGGPCPKCSEGLRCATSSDCESGCCNIAGPHCSNPAGSTCLP